MPTIPAGRGDAVVIVMDVTTSVKLLLAVLAVGVVLSVTRTVIVKDPLAGGVPLSVPVEEASVNQEGSEVPVQL